MALECVENDYEALFALCLLYAMGHNKGNSESLNFTNFNIFISNIISL